MGARVNEWFEQVKDRWQNLSAMMKRIIVLGIMSLFIVIGTFYYISTRVEYGVLFTDLSQADAGIIVNDLKEKKIAYKLEDKGSTIMIDQQEIDGYRIDLAVENKLPDSSTGFELFDQSDMMTTDEDRKVMYQRALTGELERAIGSLDGVQKVKVILVTPDDGVFSSEKKDATASIILTLNKQLSDSAIQGIVTLASGAVENLNPENVKVVDGNGLVLAGSGEENSLSNASDRYIGIKNSYEETLEKKVKKLLEPIYGAENLQVSINVDLDFDSVESTRTTYNNPEIRSESVEATGSADAIQEAQTGQANDNVTVVTGDDAEGNRTYRRDVNNELDTEITKTISAPGMIERMTSSVVISGNLPADVQQEIRALVASAVGYNEERGDEIAIQGVTFTQAEAAAEENPTTNNQSTILNNLWIYLAIGGGVLLVSLIMLGTFFILRRRQQDDFLVDDDEEELMEEVIPNFNERSQSMSAEASFADSIASMVNPSSTSDSYDELDEEDTQTSRIKSKVVDRDKRAKQFADENPEIAAELIRAWTKEK
ncbi:flagellar M-ring protein FliF [Enterococcus sp. DIV2402]|uniref:Flagellar M-ring protein n=1 Tax=Candidatus Enterococcus lowellii TaxID=2230877 RepID=A0ABZ2SKA2_9ENTE|nr:flagellar basal-body MS-ring/collar protein FliF [Enterococcus sp. DIV2402]MBO0465758.1 flagellar M-ring protein FliF [Enterococcus sp. DIV2402]